MQNDVFPFSQRFLKEPSFEIQKSLIDIYWSFKKYMTKQVLSLKSKKEIEKIILEEIRGKDGEIFNYMLTNLYSFKELKEKNLCKYYIWRHFYCNPSCSKNSKDRFIVTSIVKQKLSTPRYVLTIEGYNNSLIMTSSQLLSFNKFKQVYFTAYNIVPEEPVEKWRDVINFLVDEVFREEGVEEMEAKGKLEELNEASLVEEIKDWVSQVQTEHSLDDLLAGKPIKKDGKWYAKGNIIYNRLRRFGKRTEVFSSLKALGLKSKVLRFGDKTIKAWEMNFPSLRENNSNGDSD